VQHLIVPRLGCDDPPLWERRLPVGLSAVDPSGLRLFCKFDERREHGRSTSAPWSHWRPVCPSASVPDPDRGHGGKLGAARCLSRKRVWTVLSDRRSIGQPGEGGVLEVPGAAGVPRLRAPEPTAAGRLGRYIGRRTARAPGSCRISARGPSAVRRVRSRTRSIPRELHMRVRGRVSPAARRVNESPS